MQTTLHQAHPNKTLHAQTNGKAKRFIQTALREWAYATAFHHSDQRRDSLSPWLHRYNWHRPQASLDKREPPANSA